MFSFLFYNADHITELVYNMTPAVTPIANVNAFVETGSREREVRGSENFLNRFHSEDSIRFTVVELENYSESYGYNHSSSSERKKNLNSKYFRETRKKWFTSPLVKFRDSKHKISLHQLLQKCSCKK